MRTHHIILLCFGFVGCIDGEPPVFGGTAGPDGADDGFVLREIDGVANGVDTKLVLPDTRLVETDSGGEVETVDDGQVVEVVDVTDATDATDAADATDAVDAVEIDIVLACQPGCACDTCEGGDCTMDCNGACGCELDCADNDGKCRTTCKGDSTCTVDCQGANNCEAECKGRSHCNIDCREANNCKPLRCKEDAVCHIDCRGANNCDDFRCEGNAQCYLRCDPDDDKCGCWGATSCGDGIVACNGAPCE